MWVKALNGLINIWFLLIVLKSIENRIERMATNPLQSLVYYSIAMVSLPIVAYFLSRNLLELITSAQSANVYSAISAVIVVHILLFAFVYKAYQEDKQYAKEKLSKLQEKTD